MKIIIEHKWQTVIWNIDDSVVLNLNTEEITHIIYDALMNRNHDINKKINNNIINAKDINDLFNNDDLY